MVKITLKQLKEAIKKSWDRDTCHFKFIWDNNSLSDSAGHCRAVALIVNDYFGGEIIYAHVVGNPKWDHYWNKLPSGKEIDLTKDQFPKNVIFTKSKIISRKNTLSSKRTQKGYKILMKRVRSLLK